METVVLWSQGSESMYKEINEFRIGSNSELVTVLDLSIQALTGVFPKCREQSIYLSGVLSASRDVRTAHQNASLRIDIKL